MSEGYQTTVFHRTWAPKIVTSPEAFEAALADGWADTPAAFVAPPVENLTPNLSPVVTNATVVDEAVTRAAIEDMSEHLSQPLTPVKAKRGRKPRADRDRPLN